VGRQAIAEHIHCHEGASGVRGILGALALAKKHGRPSLLERRPPVPLTLPQIDPLICYLNLYRDFIDRIIRDPS
jgi:hypothetical protein